MMWSCFTETNTILRGTKVPKIDRQPWLHEEACTVVEASTLKFGEEQGAAS